ncbi:MAG TPA: carboxypeptidase M32 [Parachlamydiaceae bacterium]|nr:carboxypeptidase M32 [Parachlamydiaceae bacterium]
MKKEAKTDYQKLHALSYKAHLLGGISSLISWDQETMMPEDAAVIRGEQLEALSGIIHEAKTSSSYKAALAKLVDLKTGKILNDHLSKEQKAAVLAWRRDYLKEVALPKAFVEEFAKLTSQSVIVWQQAKKENAFHHFSPFLDRIVAMNRKKADLLGYKDHPYDALLDCFEPDISTKEIATLFTELKGFLTPFIKKIIKKEPAENKFLFGKFSESKQLAFGETLLKSIGYEMSKGRLDLSAHPFSSSSHPTDSRVTTRIHPSGLMSNILSVLHEGGHALYEMGLPAHHYGSPLCEAVSLGIHESQSRFFETRIGLSKPFWQYFLPLLKKTFKGKLEKISLSDFYKAINHVKPSLIRIEADEVTYNLHIVLRFELEKALIEGSLKVRDLPEAWNAKMKELLGVTPKTNAEGCLQDIHWAMGAFGYFPTYTLGNLYASHLFLGFEKAHQDWESQVASGNLSFIKEWLSKHVYRYGREFSSEELLKKATGKKLSTKAFIDYLTDKYSAL